MSTLRYRGIFLFILFFFIPSEARAAETPFSYEQYDTLRKNFCRPKDSFLWNEAISRPLLQRTPLSLYPKLGATSFDSQQQFLISIKSNKELPTSNGVFLAELPFAQSKVLYRAIQSQTVACALTQSKLSITNTLLKLSQGQPSEYQQKLQNDMQNFRSYMNERGCRVIQNTSESDPYTTRKILLDNLTMNYCDYRLYLTYLSQSIAYNNLPTPYQNSPLSQAPYAVSSYISNISNLSDKISQEVEHSKMVYNQTLSAFSDFEQAYPIHVVLNFILQDYILLQTNFTRLINPIGQFIYKASNAQGPGR